VHHQQAKKAADMKTFLEKLDRKAGQWLNTLDSQLQEPIVRAVKGEVFTHGTTSNNDHTQEAAAHQPLAAAPKTRQSTITDCDIVHQPVLRKAR
jgi:hypothetical protein